MNIFVLSEDPIEAAQMQCDQHVVKMTLETAQMLCTPFPKGAAPYKQTHYNHPCNVWVRESKANFIWLCDHGDALAEEYTYRYEKEHKSASVIRWCREHVGEVSFPKVELTPFAIAMDDSYKLGNVVASYRNFYSKSKNRFAKWKKNRKAPDWFVDSR